jgi:site-specific recombinase XerD
LKESGKREDFEVLGENELADSLRAFYGGVRQKNGAVYGKAALINIRYGIQRFLQSPPISRNLSLTRGPAFMQANNVLEGRLANIKKAGKDRSCHKNPINAEDMKKLYDSLDLNDPTGLQDKVFLDIMLHFGRRGREGLAEMTKDSFLVKRDQSGFEYVTLSFNEYDKNHKVEHEDKQQLMFASDDEMCPVRSFRKYVNVLNPNLDRFWQRPKKQGKGVIWYENAPVGKNKLAKMLSRMSEKAELSEIYTNHSLKATAATVLKEAGVTNKDIIAVTGHRNPSSLDSYVRAPNMKRRHEMSHILHQHKSSSKENLALPAPSQPFNQNLALPAPPQPCNLLAPPQPCNQQPLSTPSVSTVNTLDLHQDLPAMFQGANFNAPLTININYNVRK